MFGCVDPTGRMLPVGILALEENKKDLARKIFVECAMDGNIKAIPLLIAHFKEDFNTVISKDRMQAIYWSCKTRAKGDENEAVLYLSLFCKHGWGIEENQKAAELLFDLQDETYAPKPLEPKIDAYTTALLAIANSYEKGEGVEKDEKISAVFFQLAADQGNTEAIEKIASLNINGHTGV